MNLQALLLQKGAGGLRARGRVRHQEGEMNKAEADFAHHLEILRRTGEVKWWAFEPMKLKLAPNTTYRVDFLVLDQNDMLVCYEVKAWWKTIPGPHWEDDARVKIKMAAQLYPFEFRGICRKPDGSWHVENF